MLGEKGMGKKGEKGLGQRGQTPIALSVCVVHGQISTAAGEWDAFC